MPDLDAIAAQLHRIDELCAGNHLELAEEACRELTTAAPTAAVAWFRLGHVLLARGKPALAESALRNALEFQPAAAPAMTQLAVALQRQGFASEGEAYVRQAVVLEPAQPIHWHVLGSVLYDQRKLDEAAQALRQAVALGPQSADAWNELGIVEQALAHAEQAEQAFQNSLALAGGQIGPVANYAFFLCNRGQQEQAWQLLCERIVQDPFAPQAWLKLGEIWEGMKEWELAAAAYRRSRDLAPTAGRSGYRLARALHAAGKLTAAEDALRAYLVEFPDDADSLALLGELLIRQCRIPSGLEAASAAVRKAPSAERHSRLLLELQYDENASLQQLFLAHRQWNTAYARHLTPASPPGTARPANARPRIGVVSSEFGQSPAAFLTLPCLEHLAACDCELFCYADRTNDDEYTRRFRAAASRWRVIYGSSDEDAAAVIRRDNIDLLIDLMGHTGRRTLLFARKPAPAQMTWLGYVGTTGISANDFVLADAVHVAQGEERWYSERVLRMPHSYACYGPPNGAPAVGPLPALSRGFVTFGCFNNTPKYSATIRAAWAQILRRLPTARLKLKFHGLDDARLQSTLRQAFEEEQVAGERIVLEGWSPHAELLAAYNDVDLALDTQPYSGGLTTCEALWMGVPAITFPGQTFAGRHSTSYLTTAGYPQFIAKDIASYVELAVEWAGRLQELAMIRAQMRDQVRASPLCDARQFAADFRRAALASR